MDYILQKVTEIIVSLIFLFWIFKAFFMIIGVRLTFSGLLQPFTKKEKKDDR